MSRDRSYGISHNYSFIAAWTSTLIVQTVHITVILCKGKQPKQSHTHRLQQSPMQSWVVVPCSLSSTCQGRSLRWILRLQGT